MVSLSSVPNFQLTHPGVSLPCQQLLSSLSGGHLQEMILIAYRMRSCNELEEQRESVNLGSSFLKSGPEARMGQD